MSDADCRDRSIGSPRMDSLLVEAGGRRRWISPKRMFLLVLFAITIAAGWYLRREGTFEPAVLMRFLDDRPLSAVAIFVALYAIAVIGAIPTLPLNLLAGLLWGVLPGGVIATTSATLGASGAFFTARLLLGQPLARRFDSRLVNWLQDEFNAKGWRFIAFLRLNPVFPTGPLNYVLALTSISAYTYVWATLVFLIPPSMVVALIGHKAGALVGKGEVAHLMKTVIALSMAVAVLVAMRYAAKYLNHVRRS